MPKKKIHFCQQNPCGHTSKVCCASVMSIFAEILKGIATCDDTRLAHVHALLVALQSAQHLA